VAKLPIRNIIRAASKKFKIANELLFNFTNETYTDQEKEYFENVWANTVAGATIDKKMEFVIGGGIVPTFELIDSGDMTRDQINAKLEEFDDILQEIKEIDRKVKLQRKVFDAAIMAKVFGRSILLFDKIPIGASRQIPESLKLIHGRDIGKAEINQDDWSLKEVKVNIAPKTILPEEMIYLVNKPNSPIFKTTWQGYSELQRVVGPARALRRIQEFDAPEIAESMWAGYGTILLKKIGRSKAQTKTDASTIVDGMTVGAWNAIEVDALDEIDIKTHDLDPKIGELVQLMDRYERLIIGNSGVPAALLGREEDTNRATLLGKIDMFVNGPVAADREWLGEILTKQWYERIFTKLDEGGRAGETVRIKAEFEPIVIERWTDVIDGAQKLKQLFPTLPDTALLQLLKLEEFKDDLDNSNKMMLTAKTKDSAIKNRYLMSAATYMEKHNKEKKNHA
jgi:hypothetical protein